MSNPIPNYFSIFVPEKGTFVYSGTLTQQDGVTPIAAGALLTLKLTIKDEKTGVIINGQNQANCLNTNGVVVDITGTTGLLTWIPASLDNQIIGTDPNLKDGGFELHEAVLLWTWRNTDNRTLQSQRKIFIKVEKYAATESPIPPGVGSSRVTISLGYPNINVWITSDDLGLTRVGGTLTTDENGRAVFALTAGAVYYLWTSGVGFNPLLGQAFTAEADV